MAGIGDLVARLGLDNSGFKKGLSGSKGMLSSFAGGIGGLIAPVAGALAGIWGTSASISAAKTQLQAEQKLAAVLEATGGAAGLSAKEIGAYASELQGATNYGDEVTIGAASILATFKEIKGQTFKDTLASMQDIATVMGTDVSASAVQLGKALNNPTQGISALTKIGVSFTDQQKEQIKAMQAAGDMSGAQGVILAELQSEFGGAAKALADPWTQFTNTLGDVAENIGFLLLPSINVLAESLTGMLGFVAGGVETFKSFGIEAAVVLSHMGGILVVTATQWELFFVQLGLGAAHFFTDVAPAYITWFADNWQDVMFTAVDYTLTLFINLGQNIRDLWASVLNFFSTGKFEFDWTPLLEGAKSTISKLPDIPERAVTQFEQGLQRDITAMNANLGESMDKQREELTKKFSPTKSVPGAAGLTPPEESAAATPKTTKNDLKASFAGSQEAASIMLRGVGGKSMEQIAQKQLTVQQQTLNAVKANAPPSLTPVTLGT